MTGGQVLLIDGPLAGEVMPLPDSGCIAYEEPWPLTGAPDPTVSTAPLPRQGVYRLHKFVVMGVARLGSVADTPSHAAANAALLTHPTLVEPLPPGSVDWTRSPAWLPTESEAQAVLAAFADATRWVGRRHRCPAGGRRNVWGWRCWFTRGRGCPVCAGYWRGRAAQWQALAPLYQAIRQRQVPAVGEFR